MVSDLPVSVLNHELFLFHFLPLSYWGAGVRKQLGDSLTFNHGQRTTNRNLQQLLKSLPERRRAHNIGQRSVCAGSYPALAEAGASWKPFLHLCEETVATLPTVTHHRCLLLFPVLHLSWLSGHLLTHFSQKAMLSLQALFELLVKVVNGILWIYLMPLDFNLRKTQSITLAAQKATSKQLPAKRQMWCLLPYCWVVAVCS